MKVLRTAVLLHDIARLKEFNDNTGTVDHASVGAEMAERILRMLDYSETEITKIKHCIIVHRYRRERKAETVEARILFDADKLDSVGAVGIARVYMMAGQYGQRVYSNVSVKEYLHDNTTGGQAEGGIINISKHAPNLEFELKFKQIHRRLYTQKAKKIARKRLRFMESFFERLKSEIDGEK